MENQAYKHLLSPYKIGGVVLKNRIYASASTPEFIQGPQKYPTEALIQHYANKAKTASIVTVNGWGNTPVFNDHALIFDWEHGGCQHEITRLTESIHYYNSLAICFLFPKWDKNFDAGEGIPNEELYYTPGRPAFTRKHIDEMVENYGDMAARVQELGFDGVYLHAAYRGLPVARFLSPLTNNRRDEFGGSVENRARFLLMICDRIKQKCGRDFLIDVSISGEDNAPGGATMEDTIEVARLGVGHFDIIQPRAYEIDHAHPVGYTSKKRQPYAYMAEQIKKSGVNMAVSAVAGYFYPEEGEEALSSGKADLIAMGRAWVCNPDYGEKAFGGRRDDLVPCIRCNKCYNSNNLKPRRDVCSVNPTFTWDHRINYFIKPVGEKKKIAVVGGGPAGMEAAIECAKRGHSVTLFEKSDRLGGQLNLAEMPSFKYYITDFKDFLIYQVKKHGVDVKLKTRATADMLDGYDEIIAAVGAQPLIPPIPGSDKNIVTAAMDVFGYEGRLSYDIVVVGGGEIGTETGLHLAELGHNVHLIEMTDKLAPDAPFFHFRSMLLEYANNTKNFKYTVNATCKRITDTGVIYEDREGAEHELRADSVILATGSKSRTGEALSLYKEGRRVMLVGDCKKAADIHHAMRTGFATASQL
ncbi:MAG: FAD-dependent oxidoreductase [Oscillospiraceae bacterium]